MWTTDQDYTQPQQPLPRALARKKAPPILDKQTVAFNRDSRALKHQFQFFDRALGNADLTARTGSSPSSSPRGRGSPSPQKKTSSDNNAATPAPGALRARDIVLRAEQEWKHRSNTVRDRLRVQQKDAGDLVDEKIAMLAKFDATMHEVDKNWYRFLLQEQDSANRSLDRLSAKVRAQERLCADLTLQLEKLELDLQEGAVARMTGGGTGGDDNTSSTGAGMGGADSSTADEDDPEIAALQTQIRRKQIDIFKIEVEEEYRARLLQNEQTSEKHVLMQIDLLDSQIAALVQKVLNLESMTYHAKKVYVGKDLFRIEREEEEAKLSGEAGIAVGIRAL